MHSSHNLSCSNTFGDTSVAFVDQMKQTVRSSQSTEQETKSPLERRHHSVDKPRTHKAHRKQFNKLNKRTGHNQNTSIFVRNRQHAQQFRDCQPSSTLSAYLHRLAHSTLMMVDS